MIRCVSFSDVDTGQVWPPVTRKHAHTHAPGGNDEIVIDPAQISGTALTQDTASAKGDLFVGTGVGEVGLLSVSVDDHVLTTDSSSPNGIKWGGVPAHTHDEFSQEILIDPDQVRGVAVVENDPRLSDERVPVDGSVGAAKVADASLPFTKLSGNLPPNRVDGTAVTHARSVLSGTGLTGGGDLSNNRTLSVVYGSSAGTSTQGNDPRLSDSRTPVSHASTHSAAGTDPISPETIGALPASLFDAHSLLVGDQDTDPAALTVPPSTLVGRAATGSIAALTATEARELLNLEDVNVSESLPTENLPTGTVLAFSAGGPQIIAAAPPVQAWVATEANNTATVDVVFVYDGVEVASTTHTITVLPATYSSAMTAAVYGSTSTPAGVKFVTNGTRCVLGLDPQVYPATVGMTLSVSGPAANAMGFTDGQESSVVPGEWLAVQDSDLPSISELLRRIQYLEQGGGGGGGGLSSVRKRRSAYWYAGGPPGSVGTAVPTLGTAYALRVPGMAAGQIIDAVSVEIATALTAGNSGVMDFYVAAPNSGYEYPGALSARLASYTFTSADTGRPTIAATTPYACAEDGDYWLICVLRSGTAPTLRFHQQNTTVGFGSDSPGTPGTSTLGSPGYRHTTFPADSEIVGGTTLWTASVDPSSTVPRMYFRMG